MLNVILAPIGLLLIGLGAWGLYIAARASRRRNGSPPDDKTAKGHDDG
jgi:hypothetical protein